ncbi:MAG: fatty acid--CoA ligase [Acidimicrobiia bacterium]
MVNTLGDMIRERAVDRGDAPAITYQDRTITYAELDARSTQVAHALRAAGIAHGDRMAVFDKNVPEFFELLLGAAKVGAVLAAVNWRLAPPEIAQILNDATARVLLVGAEFLPCLEAIEPRLETVELVVTTESGTTRPGFAEWRDAQPTDDLQVEVSPDDVAVQFYTSGTTGLPKGVMIAHRAMFSLVPAANAALRLTADSVAMVAMPLFHVAGAAWGLIGLMAGAHCVLLREVDPHTILVDVERYRVTHAVYVPAVLQLLLATPGVESTDFSSLDTILYGASPISEDVLVKSLEVFGCRFLQAYGLTETAGAVVLLPPEDHDVGGPNAHRLRAAGVAMPGVELRVVDADGNDCALGDVGEVWMRSPSNMVGYWNMPEATAAAITGDGWFKSGDAGFFDADGYLYIHDRIKDMIISGGENIYPAEVESVLMGHPAVADAAVIGVPDEKWGEAVKAIVVRAPNSDLDDRELIAFSRERLAHFKCPTTVDWVDTIPRNPSGKILKTELREPYWRDQERGVH